MKEKEKRVKRQIAEKKKKEQDARIKRYGTIVDALFTEHRGKDYYNMITDEEIISLIQKRLILNNPNIDEV